MSCEVRLRPYEIAEIAQSKGFKTKTVTTNFTNSYLLGGKNVMITDLCIDLWMSEVQKWLRSLPTPIIVTPVTDFVTWQIIIDHPDIGRYIITTNSEDKWFNSYEEALEVGLLKALELI